MNIRHGSLSHAYSSSPPQESSDLSFLMRLGFPHLSTTVCSSYTAICVDYFPLLFILD